MKKLRIEYSNESIDKQQMLSDPIQQFEVWFQQAVNADIPEANAMAIATAKENAPSVRIVLLKHFDTNGFVFFSNYKSRKAAEIEENDHISAVFWWGKLSRQVRIEGKVKKVPRSQSEEYFASRPRDSQISAWASHQSSEIESREQLEQKMQQLDKQYPNEVPCPPFWGGYNIFPTTIEFWQGMRNRLHDRICFYRKDNAWETKRLSP